MFLKLTRAFAAAAIAAGMLLPLPAGAAGDLLVAPTRVVLDGRRSGEVILNNIGSEPATYRISLELRRMQPNGALEEVEADRASSTEKAALDLIRYAPRRVDLAPNQPQSIRIGLGALETLPDGEYRAHMLFRAIPKAEAPGAAVDAGEGLKIELRPIYGITIPVIVRKGVLSATASMSNARLVQDGDARALSFDLGRAGARSIYGELRVLAGGKAEPVMLMKGIGVYPEVAARNVTLRLTPEQAAQIHGPVRLQFWETGDAGATLAAELAVTL